MCNCFSEHQSPLENPSVSPQETWIDPETLLPCPVPCFPDQTQLEEAHTLQRAEKMVTPSLGGCLVLELQELDSTSALEYLGPYLISAFRTGRCSSAIPESKEQGGLRSIPALCMQGLGHAKEPKGPSAWEEGGFLAVGRDESCSGSLCMQGGSPLGEALQPVRMQSTAEREPSPGAPCQL